MLLNLAISNFWCQMEEIAANPNIKVGQFTKVFLVIGLLKAVGFILIFLGNFLAIEPILKKYSFTANITNLVLNLFIPLIGSQIAFMFYLLMILSMMTLVEDRIIFASRKSTIPGIKNAIKLFGKAQNTFNLPTFIVLSVR